MCASLNLDVKSVNSVWHSSPTNTNSHWRTLHALIAKAICSIWKMQRSEGSTTSPKTIEIPPEDFRFWDKRVTSGKTVAVPKIRDIVEVKFLRD